MFRITRTVAAHVAALGISVAPAAAQETDTIKIGLLLPYSGVFAQLARDINDAWDLAVDERDGMVAGYRVELVTEDTEGTPQVALQRANKVIQSDGASVIAGSVSSGVGIALAGVAEKEQIPFIAAFAVADSLTGEFCNPYTVRTSFSANALQSASGRYWAEQGVNTAMTLAPDYAAGYAMMEGFKRGFEGAGGEVLLSEYTPLGRTSDWAPSLFKARQAQADMIYSFFAGSEAVQIVKQHSAFGMKDSLPLRGAMWLYDEALWDAMGGDHVGAQHVTVYTNTLDTEASERFKEAFSAKFDRMPVASNALGYDNAVGTLDAIEAAIEANDGKMPEDRVEIARALTAQTIDSPRGPLTFNSSNNAVVDKLYMVEIVEGPDGPEQRFIDAIEYGDDLPGCEMN